MAPLPEQSDENNPYDLPPAEEDGKPMGFLDHLEELRWTIVKSLIVFAIAIGVAVYFFDDLARILRWPLDYGLKEHPNSFRAITSTPMAIFTVYLVIPFIGAITVALPFVLGFLAQFVAPALTKREKRLIVPGVFAAVFLFLGGGLFAYFLLVPSVVRISVELNARLGSELFWTIDGYYSMLMWMVVGMGAAFQFPMVIQVLVYLDIVSVESLRKWRRFMVLICFIAAAVITPTPDPINMTIVAFPLWVLYELAIWVAAVYTTKKRDEARS